MSSNSGITSAIYFYEQRGYVRHIKRFKKQADQLPSSLRNLINPKGKKGGKFGEFDNVTTQSLTARLAELALHSEESFDTLPPSTAGTRRHGARDTSTGASGRSTIRPYTFTDMKLHALKQLTEGLLYELQEYLNRFEDAQMRPILNGPVIYDLHSDWSDLTENCTYNYPQWRTKVAHDLTVRRVETKKNRDDDDAQSVSSVATTAYESTSNSLVNIPLQNPGSARSTSSAGGLKKGAEKGRQGFVPPRLDPITEEQQKHKGILHKPPIAEKTDKLEKSATVATINQTISSEGDNTLNTTTIVATTNRSEQARTSLIHFGGVTEPRTRGLQFNRKLSILKSGASLPQTATTQSLDISRMTANSSTSGGWAVTFNLSNATYEEKGWIIMKERVDQEPIDFERRVVRALSKSLRSIEENRIRNERFGMTKLCKLRYYGDHKREQIEKYKLSTLKPKKSNFAMSILRREIPKPLEFEMIVENLYTLPVITSSLAMNASVLSFANATETGSVSVNLNVNTSVRTLVSTHTNDGTTLVFYPSGGIAITCANVFGYFVDGASNASTTLNATVNTTANNASNMNNTSGGVNLTGATTQASSINQQSSTYTSNTANQVSTNTSVTLNTSASLGSALLNFNTLNLHDSYTTIIYDDVKLRGFNYGTSSVASSRADTVKSSVSEGRLMAIITATGNCICYRRNGQPKFICTEFGGCLCNDKGSATYQWKWDDMKSSEMSRIREELKADLNEYISLEYKNPQSIIVKFNCYKEIFEFDLGCAKENYSKLQDMIQRTASDLPLQSKAASHKISKTVKGSIQPHKPQITTQQQSSVSTRKPSAATQDKPKQAEQNTTNNNESKQIVEKLIDSSVNYKDVPVMKELLTIQKRIRGIFDEWLQFCRSALGVLEPNLYILPDFPQSRTFNQHHMFYDKIAIVKRKSKSADARKNNNLKSKEDIDTKQAKETIERSKSAYLSRRTPTKRTKDLSERIKEFKNEMSMFDLNDLRKSHRRKSRSPGKPVQHSLLQAPITEEQRLLRLHRSRTYTNNELTNADEQCPITLRYKILFDRKIDCKCKKNVVSILSDVELDRFLRSSPPEQLIVITIINSKEISTSSIESVVEQLHESFNKNRSKPCAQGMKDEFRFFFYDILSATDNSNHYQPFLVQRHNVLPGMVLMYQNAKLLFCDHIFNGYGYSLNDFLKQLHQSKLDARAGKYLPYNFRFSRPRGQHGLRTAWGGEIGGLIVVEDTPSILAKNFTNSLDSFTRTNQLNRKRPNTQQQENALVQTKFTKENTTIGVKTNKNKSNNKNFVNLPKIKQPSVEVK